MTTFGLSDKQAQAILDMRLQRLTGLERDKIKQEYDDLLAQIAHFKEILANEWMVLDIIKTKITAIKNKYADERRTEITALEGEIDMLDLVQEEDMVVTMTHYGYVKRLAKSVYRAQKRGGKGVSATATRDEDFVERMYVVSTHDPILFFTNRGRVYQINCYEIPEASRTARGTAVVNLIQLDGGEKVTAMLPIPGGICENKYLVMATRRGLIKRTALDEFTNLRKSGLIAITLREDDDLIRVLMTEGTSDLLIGSRGGMAIRFPESELRPIGRSAMGVKSIELDEGDEVVDMSPAEADCTVLSLTENGYGKRTPIEEYRAQSRGGKGIKAMNLTDKTGLLACQLMVRNEEDLMIITDDGTIIRTAVADIPILSRNTQGVRIMRVAEDCKVVCVARADAEEEEEALDAETDAPVAPETEAAGDDLDFTPETEPQGAETGEPDALDRLLTDLSENPDEE